MSDPNTKAGKWLQPLLLIVFSLLAIICFFGMIAYPFFHLRGSDGSLSWLIVAVCVAVVVGGSFLFYFLVWIIRTAWHAHDKDKNHKDNSSLLKSSERGKPSSPSKDSTPPSGTKKALFGLWAKRLIGLILILWVLSGVRDEVHWFARLLHPAPDPIQQQLANVPIPADYSATFADVATTKDYDYSSREFDDIPYIRIGKLRGGGYNDHITVPQRWKQYRVVKSKNLGDWASAWCDGAPQPGGIFWYNRDDMGQYGMKDCYVHHGDPASFRIQGKGWIEFVPVTYWW